MGVNHEKYKTSDNVISNASCTTNCLAPLAMVSVGLKRHLHTQLSVSVEFESANRSLLASFPQLAT